MQSEQQPPENPEATRHGSADSLPIEGQLSEHRSTAESDWLPSRPPLLSQDAGQTQDLTQLAPGQRLGDFLIRRVLGRGGFAAVYLALQWSLDREVALKVTAPQAWRTTSDQDSSNRGEGQHLAQLHHPNIVQVYQQSTEPHTGAQLLCMQYVAGGTLELLLGQLKHRGGQWSGRDMLDVLDRLPPSAAALEPSALRDRQTLESADHIETICLLGSQLASALEHAHRHGIFHRDIKPANVLVSRYGQPLLADFNLATRGSDVGGSGLIGGTLVYMPPESLAAFAAHSETAVITGERLCDIYSLGVLLWQASTGALPFRDAEDLRADVDAATRAQNMARRRLQTPAEDWSGSDLFRYRSPAIREDADRHHQGDVEQASSIAASYLMLGEILGRCMRAVPNQRYHSAGSLRGTLEGLAELHAARATLPSPGRLVRYAERFPITALLIMGLLPHLIASGLQITYNSSRVLGNFQPAQIDAFVQLVWWANPVIYGACLLFFCRYLWQFLPTWQRLQRRDPGLTTRETAKARRHALQLPRRAATIAGCGWLAGSIVFPVGVIVIGGQLPWAVLMHFLLSFLLAGLISVTYSAFAIAAVILRVFYLRFWLTPLRFRKRAGFELRPLDRRLDRITLLAGAIPLAAAATLIFAGPQGAGDQATLTFRLLAVSLILAGGIGFTTVGRVVAILRGRIRTWHT